MSERPNQTDILIRDLAPEDANHRRNGFEHIVGAGRTLRKVLDQVRLVAPTEATVLIEGETGTGKESIAEAVHAHSGRRSRNFVRINCAAIPAGLLESELFGHERGAFTGAVVRKLGRFELAHGGTLFLDEIGELPLELQTKLLRVLQERAFERVGSIQTQQVDVRVVAATNQSLRQLVSEKRFRSDLYYRLNVFPIDLPPLRDRGEDIPLLIRHFIHKHASRMNKRIDYITAEALEALKSYRWPGNIRELQNVIERAVILTPGAVLRVPMDALAVEIPVDLTSRSQTLAEAERAHILEALRQTHWVVGGSRGAAARLGLARTTLISRMQRLGIEKHSPALQPVVSQTKGTSNEDHNLPAWKIHNAVA